MVVAQTSLGPYASILVVIGLALGIALLILILAHVIRPARKGPVKDSTYESGMPVIGDARRRFNVRFYLVAMLFLLFDVEVVMLWPWAVAFVRSRGQEASLITEQGAAVGPGFMFVAMGVFFALILVGFLYEWRKGVFQWD